MDKRSEQKLPYEAIKTFCFTTSGVGVINLVPGTIWTQSRQFTIVDNFQSGIYLLSAMLNVTCYDNAGAAANIPLTNRNEFDSNLSFTELATTDVIGDSINFTLIPLNLLRWAVRIPPNRFYTFPEPLYFDGYSFIFQVWALLGNNYIPVGNIDFFYDIYFTLGLNTGIK